MKKTLAFILVLVMCLGICACTSNNKEAYDTHLAGKMFENDGRMISFDSELYMTYKYTNLIGNTFRYTYSVEKIVASEDKLTLTLELDSANDYSETDDKNKKIEAVYNIADNTLEYYSLTYTFVK